MCEVMIVGVWFISIYYRCRLSAILADSGQTRYYLQGVHLAGTKSATCQIRAQLVHIRPNNTALQSQKTVSAITCNIIRYCLLALYVLHHLRGRMNDSQILVE